LKKLILETLNITNGNQVKAAKVLGLSRSKLRYRMEQLGIEVKKSIT
jgi:transcriptional regulator with GAF, ATPase, and Fis domain